RLLARLPELAIHRIENDVQLVAPELLVKGLAHEGAQRLGAAFRDLPLGFLQDVGGNRQRDLLRGHTFILPRRHARSRPVRAARSGFGVCSVLGWEKKRLRSSVLATDRLRSPILHALSSGPCSPTHTERQASADESGHGNACAPALES